MRNTAEKASHQYSPFNLLELISKIVGWVSGQGEGRRESGAHTIVSWAFETGPQLSTEALKTFLKWVIVVSLPIFASNHCTMHMQIFHILQELEWWLTCLSKNWKIFNFIRYSDGLGELEFNFIVDRHLISVVSKLKKTLTTLSSKRHFTPK